MVQKQSKLTCGLDPGCNLGLNGDGVLWEVGNSNEGLIDGPISVPMPESAAR